MYQIFFKKLLSIKYIFMHIKFIYNLINIVYNIFYTMLIILKITIKKTICQGKLPNKKTSSKSCMLNIMDDFIGISGHDDLFLLCDWL